MTDRRRRLLNTYEILTADVLAEAARIGGAAVAEKVRVADALEIEESGLTDEEYGYALRAHFDFVVVVGEEHSALFAVEFDGPSHDTPDGLRLPRSGSPAPSIGTFHTARRAESAVPPMSSSTSRPTSS